MPYVGNQIRQYSDRVVLDSLTASATADYTLQLNSVNFVPSSAESLTVSLNGIIQAPISSYTVSGSTLSFDSALTASDTIDFIIAERGITFQTPSAGSVNTTQLATDAVSTAKIADGAVTYAKSTGFGKIGQVITQQFSGGATTTTSSNWSDTFMTKSITPTSTSSKIAIWGFSNTTNTNQNAHARITIFRGSTNIGTGTQSAFTIYYNTSNSYVWVPVTVHAIDAPATTSEVTYTFKIAASSGTAYWGLGENAATITLMEVLG